MVEFRRRCDAEGRERLEGLPEWMSDLLLARGIDTPERAERFLHPSLEQLYDPMKMLCMGRAVEMIREAIGRGDRILVYGDYDVDGISACTVLLETLREEGADADFRVPHRHTEGYGLNTAAVEEIAKAYQLLITVDCGISNVAEVARAKALGMKVIVTDHHEIPETLPDADAILDPLLRPEQIAHLLGGETEPYPFPRLCGAGVALKICQALQGMAGVEKRLEVAALATVADIVPLVDENRVIVREGLLRMPHSSRPGLRALMECASVHAPVSSEDIAFRLGPRLNAAGRLEHAEQGVRLLMTRDEEEGRKLAEHLEKLNRERQDRENAVLKEAADLFRVQADLTRDRIIILEGEDWNTGLIGLAAGKFCERLHHPTIVLSRQGDTAVGSCRSIPGINIFDMLGTCTDILVRYGGHAQAAGLTVKAENIPELRLRLNREIRERCDDRCFIPIKDYDTEMALADVTLKTVEELSAMEPTGFGNPAPVFLVRGASVQSARRVGKDHSHLRISLLEGNAERSGIGFGLGDEADHALRTVDALFRPDRNEYNGRVSAQIQVQALRPASGRRENPKETENERKRNRFLEFLQEMSMLASKNPEYGGVSFRIRPEHLLKERIRRMDLTDEELRTVYKTLRDLSREGSGALGSAGMLKAELSLTEEQLWTVLTAFRETGLLQFQVSPFRVELNASPARCRMTDSPLIRYLRGCREPEETLRDHTKEGG